MPPPNKRTLANRTNIINRYNSRSTEISFENSNIDSNDLMSIEQVESNDLYDFNSFNYGTNKSHNGCQTESKIVHDVSTQTYDLGEAKYLDIISKYFCIERVTDLICLFIDSVNNWNSYFDSLTVIKCNIFHIYAFNPNWF